MLLGSSNGTFARQQVQGCSSVYYLLCVFRNIAPTKSPRHIDTRACVKQLALLYRVSIRALATKNAACNHFDGYNYVYYLLHV